MRRYKTLGALGIVAAGTTLMGALLPSTLCACITADSMFSMAFGANPIYDDAASVRASVLEKLPPGMARAAVEEELRSKHVFRYCKALAPTAVDCVFNVRESRSLPWFERVREGFSLRLVFDAEGKLADAVLATHGRLS